MPELDPLAAAVNALPDGDTWGLAMHPEHYRRFCQLMELKPSMAAELYVSGGDFVAQLTSLYDFIDALKIYTDKYRR